jgi:hypothetical protein
MGCPLTRGRVYSLLAPATAVSVPTPAGLNVSTLSQIHDFPQPGGPGPPYLYRTGTEYPSYKLAGSLSVVSHESTYLTGNTLSFRYKDQPANAVLGDSRCLL